MAPTASTSKKKPGKKLANVDGELCGVCQACATVCPVNAIEVTESFVMVLPEKCTGCGVCVSVCPVGAITLIER
ncbi:MAG: 4Fe-4S binding protein [Candidatus Hermodarchaeota archaeon]|jgi:Fe-S-cluster-containing hydrogenase component 2|nr:4Fe-4S binding protein [Candidatus Hermodarchaeota archaeon]